MVDDEDSTPEKKEEKLKSILAQLEFAYRVRSWDEKGVPFRTFMYVPEVHPVTGTLFHEREDDGHVPKVNRGLGNSLLIFKILLSFKQRIAGSTRAGGPKELRLERFADALQDPSSGLTFPAFTGQRKQSIRDAEILLSQNMVAYMKKKDYAFEAKYIQVMVNWRQACDERGLSQLQRCRYNYQLLQYLFDDLMPWHRHEYDLSLLEVNRYV